MSEGKKRIIRKYESGFSELSDTIMKGPTKEESKARKPQETHERWLSMANDLDALMENSEALNGDMNILKVIQILREGPKNPQSSA